MPKLSIYRTVEAGMTGALPRGLKIETELEKDLAMKKQRHLLAGTLLMSVMWAVPILAQDYDLVINNGRVMDPETLYDLSLIHISEPTRLVHSSRMQSSA